MAKSANGQSPVLRDRVIGLRRVKASSLLPHSLNYRRHPKAQRSALAGVMREIGYAGALLAYETPEGLRLIDGHLRAELTPEQEVPVLVLDVDETEARKLLATYDTLGAMAQPDSDALMALLQDVHFESPDVTAMLEALANGETQPMPDLSEGPEPQIDRAEELRAKWKTERGQVWDVASVLATGKSHRLMCGDSTSREDVERLLSGAEPFLCVTDPPYGVNYDPGWRNEMAKSGHLAYADRRIGKVTNDDRSNWRGAWELFPGDVIYSWHPAGAPSLVHAEALQSAGFILRMQIIWAKSHFPIGRGDYHVQHEPCWYAVRKGASAKRTSDRTQTTLWEINLDRNVEGGHSTQKPIQCMARPIYNHEAAEVYDPFLGSGTTMVAAEQLRRVCYAVEINPAYVAVSLQRMADMGLKPRLVNA